MRWFRRRRSGLTVQWRDEEQEPDDFRPLLAQACSVCRQGRARHVVATDAWVVVDGLGISSALGLCPACIGAFRRGDVDGLFARQDLDWWEDSGPQTMAAVVNRFREVEV
jgi:hypothetical protein